MTFNKYANYYDFIYKNKDYVVESKKIDELIQEHIVCESPKILDLGCGTGTHANILKHMGYDIVGVDLSPDMIEIAKQKNEEIPFFVGDIVDFRPDEKADVVIALFHVVSYITKDESIIKFFKNVYDNTKEDMLFVFDVWCGNGVLTDPPEVRVKEIDDRTTRIAEPNTDFEKQIVTVNYLIQQKNGSDFRESHEMRYFFPQELVTILKSCGFTNVTLQPKPITKNTWGLEAVCRK